MPSIGNVIDLQCKNYPKSFKTFAPVLLESATSVLFLTKHNIFLSSTLTQYEKFLRKKTILFEPIYIYYESNRNTRLIKISYLT